jgi:hypothetical protein
MSLANKFNVSQSLLDCITNIMEKETKHQAKVRALMAKKGIKSLGDLSPEEKKAFFNDLADMSSDKVELDEAIPKSTTTDEAVSEFTSQQLAKMRDEYGKINTIDPSGPAYKQLIAMLDKMNIDNLKTLAGAKIKFVSGLAQNRVKRASMKKEEIEKINTIKLFFETMKKTKNEVTAKDNNKNIKSGNKLSGKQEPVEINPELKEENK